MLPFFTLFAGQVPQPSNQTPPPAALDSAAGSGVDYARADHTHAVKVQRMVGTTDVNGNVTMVFARPFINPPAVTALPNTIGQPIAVSITSKSTTQVTLNCKQSRTLPATIALLSALLNYSVFSDPAANVQVDIFAAEVTQ